MNGIIQSSILFICMLRYGLGIRKDKGCFKKNFPTTSCFQSSDISCDGSPILESFTPESPVFGPNPPDTKFFLFTLSNPKYPEYLHCCGGKLPENTNFNPNYETELFVHGSRDGTCLTAWMREMRDQLFMRREGTYNVILVDWTWSSLQNRSIAVANTKVVGEQIAFVISNIMAQTGSDGRMFHFIGHSLGAHISGFAGKRIQNLRRITGLDPSRDPYQQRESTGRLDRSDAIVVDNIHTSAYDGGIGFTVPLGDADFFPNGGLSQNQNAIEILHSYLKLDVRYATGQLDPTLYDHLIAIQYYKISINPCGCEFVGVECPNYDTFQQGTCNSEDTGPNIAVMGMNFELYGYKKDDRNHTYYLNTNCVCPYCDSRGMNVDGFSLKNSSLQCENKHNLQ